MTALRVWRSRVLDLILRRRRDDRIDGEIQAHLDLLTDEYVARGMSHADAQLAARRSFGGVEQMKEIYRDQRGLPLLEALQQDLRFAIRILQRDPGFTLTAVLVLALGIGVSTMQFTVLNAHTLRGLPIPRPERVASVSTLDDRGQDRGISFLDFEDLRSGTRSFEALVAFAGSPVVVSGDGRAADRLDGLFVAGDVFSIVGGQPLTGRGLTPDDERSGAPLVVLISRAIRETRYASDGDALGRSILVNGTPATVVGVMRDRSGFPSAADIWLPLAQLPGLSQQKRSDRGLRVLGRVRDDTDVSRAAREVEGIAARLSRDYPETNRNVRARVIPVNERYFGSWSDPAWLAFVTAGLLIVIISAANVANLMLARAVRRTREMAIRASLGASRRRLVRQLLAEGSVLAIIGGVSGLGLAAAGLQLFRSAIPENALPYWFDYSLDARVVTALAAVSFGTLFIFALLPALHASKTDVNRVLKDGGHGGPAGRTARRWSTVFLTAEIALAVVLLAQVALSTRLSRPPLPSEDVIDTREVLTAAITLAGERFRTPAQRLEFYRLLEERLRAVPDVSVMSFASAAPLAGAAEARIAVSGRPETDSASQPAVRTVAIGPRYFDALGLQLLVGRQLVDADFNGDESAVVVNEKFVRQVFGTSDPIGQRFSMQAPGGPGAAVVWGTVVGVAPDIRQRPMPEPDPIVYVPYASNPAATTTLLIRSRAEPMSLAARLKDEVAALDSNLPLYRVRTMEDVVWNAQWNGHLSRRLIFVLTLIAVALSAIGLYAVTMHAVVQRTHEIGVRMALGARPAQVLTMIIRRALVQVGFGLFAGIVCTSLWDASFSSGRAGVTILDPRSLTIVCAALMLVTAIACAIPARRATRLNAITAIRHD